ncbi:MAG: hypothetical protein KQH63_22190 [Desulfobulbaceae bacterium]|nr:hypothetical protein [Desulfobulbaceae bacterium]
MTTLQPLYFPDALISSWQASQELLFFDKIFYYLPCEADDPPEIDGEFYQGYPPIPFQGELDKFKQLIRELKGNEAEFYSGQLSTMTVNHLENRDMATVKDLIETISGHKDAKKIDSLNHREDIWQARLLLQLALILAKEEEELQAELEAIAHKEEALFESLKGEAGLPLLRPRIPEENRSPVRPEIIFKAWAKLCLEDTRQQHWLLTCSSAGTAEILFEENEILSNQRPIRLFRIPLPFTENMTSEQYLKSRAEFRENAGEILSSFASQLAECSQKGLQNDTLKQCTALAAEWTRLFSSSGPWGHETPHSQLKKNDLGAPHLEVYLCNRNLTEMLGHFCKTEVAPVPEQENRLAVIAVKSRKPSTCKG